MFHSGATRSFSSSGSRLWALAAWRGSERRAVRAARLVALCALSMVAATAEPGEIAPPSTAHNADWASGRSEIVESAAVLPAGEVVVDDAWQQPYDPSHSIRPLRGPKSYGGLTGARAEQRPLWGPASIQLVDPLKYDRIRALDCDNPNGVFYTYRPNLFGLEVPDEWDWLNLINTDRPDFTDTTFTVGKGIGYLETGYTFHRIVTSDEHLTTRQLPESLLRYGVTENVELRLKWTGYLMIDQRDLPSGAQTTQFGTEDTDTAFKWLIWGQDNWRPRLLLLAGALQPTGTRGFSGNGVQPHFNLLQGWQIRRWMYLKHQSGWDYLTQPLFGVIGSGTGLPVFSSQRPVVDSWHESLSLLTQWTRRVGAFHEWYMLYGHNQPTSHFLDMGAFIYFTPNIQVDLVIGTGLTAGVNDKFAKAGFSTRW